MVIRGSIPQDCTGGRCVLSLRATHLFYVRGERDLFEPTCSLRLLFPSDHTFAKIRPFRESAVTAARAIGRRSLDG